MKTHTITTYNFEELSEEAKENVIEYVRNNWHNLGDYTVTEFVESLKALADYVNGDFDYSISIVPDRGEFISLTGYSQELLEKLYKTRNECPLTGMCYDIYLIEALYKGNINNALDVLHSEGERIYSNEGIGEMLIVNGYEFTKDGEIYR